jgi:hypothetical protein
MAVFHYEMHVYYIITSDSWMVIDSQTAGEFNVQTEFGSDLP